MSSLNLARFKRLTQIIHRVHQDLKPDNILVSGSEELLFKLVDFGYSFTTITGAGSQHNAGIKDLGVGQTYGKPQELDSIQGSVLHNRLEAESLSVLKQVPLSVVAVLVS